MAVFFLHRHVAQRILCTFVEMLEHGMPPACGWGHGERLFAILAGKPLRETQMFPLMKPR